jgi:hypothetical protein
MENIAIVNELYNIYDSVKSVIAFDGERYIVTYHDINSGEQLPTIYRNISYKPALKKAVDFINCQL